MKKNFVTGIVLVALGLFFFLNNFFEFDINFRYVWPLILIAVGIYFMLSKEQKKS